MILSGQNTIEEVLDSKVDFEYHKLEEDQNWKVNMLAEIIDVLNGEKIIEDSETDDLTDILEYLCTGWFLFFIAGFYPAQIPSVWERFSQQIPYSNHKTETHVC